MQKPDATPIVVATAADAVQPRFQAVEQLTPEQLTEFQHEMQAVLRIYERLRAERIKNSH